MAKKIINLIYFRENEINSGYLSVHILPFHLHWQKKLRSTEHPYPFSMDAERSYSYRLVFNIMNPTYLPASWFMTVNRESVKPAFQWVGNRLEYLDSFHVQYQLVLLDIKETSENAPDLLQSQSEIQGDESLLAVGKCHEYIIEAYTGNHRKKTLFLFVNKKYTLILNKISDMWWDSLWLCSVVLVKSYWRKREFVCRCTTPAGWIGWLFFSVQ